MKKQIVFISALVLTSSSSILAFGANEFPWPMFLPAITGAAGVSNDGATGVSSDLTCSGIAGCYSGTLSDNCPGYWVGGKVGVTVNTDCTFSGISQYGVEINGAFTSKQGDIFTGSATTDANGCGQFSITCTDYGSSISCDYQYANGKTGTIRSAYQQQCRSNNQYLTETLAGSWIFSYTIISTWVDYYDLDVDSVAEYPIGSNEYSIYGDDQYGNLVVAGYDPDYGDYSLYDPGSVIDQLFTFNYTNTDTVAGCYYQYSHSSGAWSNCFPMTGTRSSTSRILNITPHEYIETEEEHRLLVEQGSDNLTEKVILKRLNELRDRFVAK